MSKNNILVIGASGQIGSELVFELAKKYPERNVIASDIRQSQSLKAYPGMFIQLDVLNTDHLYDTIRAQGIGEVYQLAAMLSASSEKHPLKAWELNMSGLLNLLEIGREGLINKLFWPSSIAVFGPDARPENTPQESALNPTSVYGISKVAGEQWCKYYFEKHGVDVRSIRYPGLVSHKGNPGGGTTDYAVHIFHEAIKTGQYACFLSAERSLPMLYMNDAIAATIRIMEASKSEVTVRSSYNLPSLSFSPKNLAAAIKDKIPAFDISYNPDFRDELAKSWPQSIDGQIFKRDFDWEVEYELPSLVDEMMKNIEILALK